jgi:hypothetical protein
MNNGLTQAGNKYLQEATEVGEWGGENPFVYKDGALHMRFDNIIVKNATLITNSMEPNKRMLSVLYCWHGEKLYSVLAAGVAMDPGKDLSIEGVEGTIKMGNSEQFGWKDSDINVAGMIQIADHLKRMTDLHLSVIKKESNNYPDSSPFKRMVLSVIEKRET